MRQNITIERPPELIAALAAMNRILELRIGEVARFDPPLEKPVVAALYNLLEAVNKEWTITPGPQPKLGFWASLKRAMTQPVTFDGRPIPQTIAEIQRKR